MAKKAPLSVHFIIPNCIPEFGHCLDCLGVKQKPCCDVCSGKHHTDMDSRGVNGRESTP